MLAPRCPFRCGAAVRMWYEAERLRREQATFEALARADFLIREARLLEERVMEHGFRRRRARREAAMTIVVKP